MSDGEINVTLRPDSKWLTVVQSTLNCHGTMECRYKEGSYGGALQLLTSGRLLAFP